MVVVNLEAPCQIGENSTSPLRGLFVAVTQIEKEGETMEAEKHDGCMCPRCNDRISEEFYCRTCGYLPDWRQMADKYEAFREAA